MASEPRWSVTDLAGHKKVKASLLYVRAKKTPLPTPLDETRTVFNATKSRAAAARYARSELLAWFEKIDAIKTVKRLA
jgi:hypothetical protein